MRLLYVIASYLLFAALLPVLGLHRKTRQGLLQRFGFYPRDLLPEGGSPRILLHGASAGDLLALSPLIPRLRARFPEARIILSTITNSGYMMGSQRLARQVDAVVYAPWDLWGTTRRALRRLAPDLLVLEYTEVWPNLIRAAHRRGARIALTNGRFSPEHVGRYRLLFTAIGNPLRDIDLFLMREDEEAERARTLGAPPARVEVTGNTKFDALTVQETPGEVDTLALALGFPPGAAVWIAGSTHEGEEERLLPIYLRLRQSYPDLRLVIAPRYIERAGRITALVEEAGLPVALRSRGNAEGAPVVVLDTIGELARVYELGTVVFVGGSFIRRGGQNILEPAGHGRPVLFGPHMENFHDSVQVLVGRGGIQVNDEEHLFRTLHELLARPEAATALGELARAAVQQIRGASDRNVALLARLLGRPAR